MDLEGLWEDIVDFFTDLWDKIVSWFEDLF